MLIIGENISINLANTFRKVLESGYPELRTIHIKVHFSESLNTSMSTRPSILSLIKKKKKWIFHVFIKKGKERSNIPLLVNATEKGIIGCIAHEYSHIVDYISMTRIELAIFGLKYLLCQSFRSRIERENDLRTIDRGFGFELYEFAKYVFSNASKKYLRYKKKNYFTPEEILTHTLTSKNNESAANNA